MRTVDLVDNALELLVVPSFSRWGYHARRRLYDWQALPAQSLAGQTALVTGPTSGLGRSIAGSLAELGARVVLVGRNADKLAGVRDELTMATRSDRFPTVVADLSSRLEVVEAVDSIRATESRLDVVIDNAGGLYPERRESADGIELTLALMVVGPFMLLAGLLPLLRAGSGGRVVAVTSGGMYTQPVDLDDLEWRGAKTWSGSRSYARAKRIQVALMREWARRSAGSGVTFNAMHPGWADTPGLSEALPAFRQVMAPILRTPTEGDHRITGRGATPANLEVAVADVDHHRGEPQQAPPVDPLDLEVLERSHLQVREHLGARARRLDARRPDQRAEGDDRDRRDDRRSPSLRAAEAHQSPTARCRKAAISARVVEAVGQKRVDVQPPVMFALARRLIASSWIDDSSSTK